MEAIIFGPSAAANDITKQLDPFSITIQPYLNHLGEIFYFSLKFEKKISAIVKASFFQLRTITKLKFLLI